MKTHEAVQLDTLLYITPHLREAHWNRDMCEKCHVVKLIPPKANYDNTNLLYSSLDLFKSLAVAHRLV